MNNTFKKLTGLVLGLALAAGPIFQIPLTFAATTTPGTINYQGRLLDNTSTALVGSYTFRFSLWNSADWNAPDTTGGGAINTGAATYAGWQETDTVTTSTFGLFDIPLGSTTPLPNFNAATHPFLQVEVKPSAAPDTSYEVLDPAGTLADVTDRSVVGNQPFSVNADYLDNAEIGTGPGNIALLGLGGVFSTSVIPTLNNSNLSLGLYSNIIGVGTLGGLTTTGTNIIGDGTGPVSIASTTWNINAAGVATGITGLTSTGDVNLSNATSFSNPQGATDPVTCTPGQQFYNTTTNTLMVCTSTNTWTPGVNSGGADLFDGLDSTQFLRRDATDNYTTGTLSFDTGTTLAANGDVNLSNSTGFRIRENADPNTNSACASVGEFILNTTSNQLMKCTGTGIAGVATWTNVDTTKAPQGAADPATCVVGDEFFNTTSSSFEICTATNTWTIVGSPTGADLLDGVDGSQFLRSDTSDNYTSGTLTFDAGTNLTNNGTINGTGTDNFSGAAGFRIRENSNPNALAACSSLDELIINTTTHQLMKCTAAGIAGVATWTNVDTTKAPQGATDPATCAAGDEFFNTTSNSFEVCTATNTWTIVGGPNGADKLDGLDSTQFLRRDASDSYTTGTLTFNAGTTIAGNGDVNLTGATRFAMPQGLTNPLTCAIGDEFFNTTDTFVYSCTAVNTWTKVGDGTDAAKLGGLTNGQFLRSDTSSALTSGTLTLNGGTTLTNNGTINGTGIVNLSGSSSYRIREDADPNTTAACSSVDELIINTTTHQLMKCTATGIAGVATWTNVDTTNPPQGAADPGTCSVGQEFYNTTGNQLKLCTATNTWTVLSTGSQDFEGVYSTDADKTLTTGNNPFSVDVGSSIFNIYGATNLNNNNNSATNINTGTSTGPVSIGGGGGTVAIDSSVWSINAAGVAAGITGLTSTGDINLGGATTFTGPQGVADPVTCSVGQEFYNTTTNTFKICTSTNTWTNGISSNGADKLDGLDSTQFLRRDASDSYTTGTLTFNAGTTVAGNGDVNLSGSTGLRLRENADPNTNSACASVGEVIMNTTTNQPMKCTGTGIAGVATWTDVDTTNPPQGATNPVACTVGDQFFNTTDTFLYSCSATNTWTKVGDGTDAAKLGGLTPGQFLRSDTSDNYTSGTLTFDAGTNLTNNGTINGTGTDNFSGAAGFRIRESSNPNALAACAAVGELIMNTTSNQIMRCATTGIASVATWSNIADLEGVYANDADKVLTTSNGNFTVSAGTGTVAVNGVTDINKDNNKATNIGTGTTTSTVSIGGGSNSVAIDSSTWDISSGGTLTGATIAAGSNTISGITNSNLTSGSFGAITGTGTLTSGATGAGFTLNFGTSTLSGNVPVTNGGTGATTASGARTNLGAAASGANSDITSLGSISTIDLNGGTIDGATIGASSPAAATFTNITGTGAVNLTGASRFAMPQGAANPGTCTKGDEFFNTTDAFIYVCTATNTWSKIDAGTLSGLTSGQFLRSDTSSALTSGTLTLNGGTTLTNNGTINGSGDVNFTGASTFKGPQGASDPATCGVGQLFYNTTGNQLKVCTATNTWSVLTTGSQDFEGVYATDADKTITTSNNPLTVNVGSSNFNVTGITNLNNNNNTATNIGTGTTTSTVSIGGGSNQVAIDSSSWDISGAGVASGLTGLTSTGSVNLTGASAFSGPVGSSDPATCTEGQQFYNNTIDALKVCTAPNTWTISVSGNGADMLDGLQGNQFLRRDASDSYTTGTLTLDPGTTLLGDGAVDLSGSSGLRVREDADPNTTASCGTLNELIMNTTSAQLMRCTGTGIAGVATWTNVDTTGGTADFESTYTNDADKVMTTSNGAFTVNTGTNNFIVDSNLWNVTAAGALDAATITSNGATTSTGLLTANAGENVSGGTVNINHNSNNPTNINTGTSSGAVAIGGGSGTLAIDTFTWDITAPGVASGLTGLTTTGDVNLTGANITGGSPFVFDGATPNANKTTFTIADPSGANAINFPDLSGTVSLLGNATTGTGSVVLQTSPTINTPSISGPTITGSPTAAGATWGDLGTVTTADINGGNIDGTVIGGTSPASGTFTNLTTTGPDNIGNNSNTVAIDSSTWDITGSGVASGLTGLTSTGTINIGGASSFTIPKLAADPVTCTVGQIYYNTTTNTFKVCTGTNTWTNGISSNGADLLDGVDSTQFLRSDTSDNYTSGTLTFDNGTTLAVNGVANIGDNGDAVAIDSNTWDISSAGAGSGFTGFSSSGTVSFTSGMSSSGGTINLNASSNNPVNIGSGTSTGTVTIGGTGAQSIDVGDGVGAKTVGVGSSNTTSTTNLLSGSGGLNLNASNNQPTNIGTGTTTGTVSIGGGSDQVAVNSSTWDISGAGVASGFTGITSTGAMDFTGGTYRGPQGAADPGTCSVGQEFYNTTSNVLKVCTATNTWSTLSTGTPSFEAIYAADGDNTLTTTNGAFTIAAGSGAVAVNSTNAAGITLNGSVNGAVNLGTGTSTGTVTLGGTGAQTIALGNGAGAKTVNLGSSNTTSTTTILSGSGGVLINDANNQSTSIGTGTSTGTVTLGGTGAQTIAVGNGAGAKTVNLGSSNTTSTTTILSGSGGLALNVNNNQPTNIGTGTTTGTVSIGGNADNVAIDSSVWDITGAGVASGLTGLTSSGTVSSTGALNATGTVDFSGATSTIPTKSGTTDPATCTVGMEFYNTTSNLLKLCTATNTWTILSTGSTSLQNSYNGGAGITTASSTPIAFTLTSGGFNVTGAGATAIGNNAGTVAIDSTSWDVSSAGVASGLTGITSANGSISLNDGSGTSTTSIGGGTTTGTVTLGGTGAQTIALGNGAGAKTVNLGSSNTTSTTTILSGSGGVLINDANNQPTSIGTGTSTGTVTLGGTGAQTVSVGNGAGAKTVNLGSSNTTSTTTILSGSGGLALNVNNNQPTNIGTGTTTGTVSIGGNADNVAIDSSVWDITGAGVASGLTGITSANGTVSLNANSGSNTTSIGTGTTTGAVSIGGGSNTLAINSSSWDISTAGVASGFTGLTSTGAMDFTGGTYRGPQGAADPGTCAVGQEFYNTTSNVLKVCTAVNTWSTLSSGSSDFESVYANDADKILTTTNGAFTIAAGSGAVAINSTNATGITLNGSVNGAINLGTGTSTGTITIGGTGAQTLDFGDGAGAKTVGVGSSNTTSTTNLLSGSGGLNLNVSNNQATNIGTGTTTGTVSIGGTGAQTIAVGNGAGAKTVGLGSSNTTSTTTILSGSGGVLINDANNQPTSIGTGTSTGTVTLGGTGAQTIAVGNGAGAKTVGLGSSNTTSTTTLLSGSGGLLLNVNNNQPTNIGTGTTTGTVTLGGNANNVAIDSNVWDITGAGVASGLTGVTSTGTVNFSGASATRVLKEAASNPGTCTIGEQYFNTTDKTVYVCTATNTWSGGGATSGNYSAASDNTTQTLTTLSTWKDIVFASNDQLDGWTHTAATGNFTCASTGLYMVYLHAEMNNSGTDTTFIGQLRAFNSTTATEVPGSNVTQAVRDPASHFSNVNSSFVLSATAGDVIKFQFTGVRAGTGTAANFSLMTSPASPASIGATRSANVTIVRLK